MGMTTKSPGAAAVRAAVPLSAGRPGEPLACCGVCGRASDSLGVWREHDEWDRPIDGRAALVFIGRDHPDCLKRMEKHPRLYAEEGGLPGAFPALCGDCPFRRPGLNCGHADLKENGGPGLNVTLSGIGIGVAFVCIRGRSGPIRPVHHAVACAGKPA